MLQDYHNQYKEDGKLHATFLVSGLVEKAAAVNGSDMLSSSTDYYMTDSPFDSQAQNTFRKITLAKEENLQGKALSIC
jgi:hypothetical protein